jgi:hypothetical protein
MKKIIGAFIIAVLASCELDNHVPLNLCYLKSEQRLFSDANYTYNQKNELISYSSQNVYSSVLTYDVSGKIVSELDNDYIQITYAYDNKNSLVLWEESVAGTSYLKMKFNYNSYGQDTLKQLYRYDLEIGSYYLANFVRHYYSSTNTNNYSIRKTYDSTGTLLNTENFIWDSHPNPYLNNAFFLNEMPPTNNVTQYTFIPAGGVPQTTNYTYTYNKNGFPLSQTIPGYGTILVYAYTNCK